jgi:putative YpdA family bacillithiol system oxidoreductase
MFDLVVVGSGPIGIAMAREAADRGLKVALVDKGPLLGAMYQYPTHMKFFSTSEKIEICGLPFPTPEARPTRFEALEYYRLVATHQSIEWFLYQAVDEILGEQGDFKVMTTDSVICGKYVVIATGFFNRPVELGVDGENLPHVSHYFTDGHAYAGLKTIIVGAANSAVIAALECWRHGAEVTLIHREDEFHPGVKYWLRPDIENRIKDGEIKAIWKTNLQSIHKEKITLKTPDGEKSVESQRVLLLTGYRANFAWLKKMGLTLDDQNRPEVSETNFESTTRPGIYCAGCVLCGNVTNELFIENGRFHAEVIAEHLISL